MLKGQQSTCAGSLRSDKRPHLCSEFDLVSSYQREEYQQNRSTVAKDKMSIRSTSESDLRLVRLASTAGTRCHSESHIHGTASSPNLMTNEVNSVSTVVLTRVGHTGTSNLFMVQLLPKSVPLSHHRKSVSLPTNNDRKTPSTWVSGSGHAAAISVAVGTHSYKCGSGHATTVT